MPFIQNPQKYNNNTIQTINWVDLLSGNSLIDSVNARGELLISSPGFTDKFCEFVGNFSVVV